MPVTVAWANEEHTILLIDHDVTWTWEEMFQAYQEALKHVRATDHTVHIVVDHSREVDPPANFVLVLPRFAALPVPSNVGLIIQVGTRGATRAGTELFSKLYRKLHLVDMIEDAYALIKVHEERRSVAG